MTGSLVLAAYGARLIPGDLDITPALDPDNLEAIATVLSEVEAIPLLGTSEGPQTPVGHLQLSRTLCRSTMGR